MARGPGPTVAVVEDLDYPNCIAGWWGEVHVAVHKGLGLKGAITNGVMRDLDVIDEIYYKIFIIFRSARPNFYANRRCRSVTSTFNC